MKLLLENWREYLNEVSFSDAKEILDSNRTLKIIKAYRYDKGQGHPDYPDAGMNTQHRNFKNYLLDVVPDDLTDNQKGTSVLWLLKLSRENPEIAANFINGRIFARQRGSLETFFHHQRFMPRQDLIQVKTMKDLIDMTDAAKEEIQKAQEKKNYLDAEEGTEVLSGKMERNKETGKLERSPGKNGWFIAIIHNKGAACELGKETDWCTAADLGYFKDYYEPDDPLFFFEGFWTDPSTRFQFHYGSESFMDSDDRPVKNETLETLHSLLKRTEAYDKYEKLKIFDLKRMAQTLGTGHHPAGAATTMIDKMREILNTLKDPQSMAYELTEMATLEHFNVPTYILRWLASEEFYKYVGVARRIVKYHEIVPSNILKDLAENNPNVRTRELAKNVLERRSVEADAAAAEVRSWHATALARAAPRNEDTGRDFVHNTPRTLQEGQNKGNKMKLLLENWRKYLLTEQATLWDYKIRPDQKVFLSSEPWTTFKPTLQVKPDYAGQKPKGLWYGCGDSWIEWIKLNMPGSYLEKANYLYEVKLGEEIIQISSDDEFDNFQSKFGFPLGKRGPAINWKEIQEQEYNGIEICPHNWERREELDWYCFTGRKRRIK